MNHLLLVAACSACALASMAAEVESTTLKAVFSDSEKGRFSMLVDRRGQNYLSMRNVSSPLWQAEVCRKDDFGKKAIVRATEARQYSSRPIENGVEMTWTDVGKAVEKAVAVFVARPGDPAIRCRITVTPKPGWALVETQFPRAALNECLGTTPTDDAIVMGTGHGGLVRHPMDPRREFWRNRHVGHSPGNLVAQFGCFFDDRGGLYTMSEDPDGNEKELLMDRWWINKRPDGSWTGGDFMLRWSRFEYSETTDSQPYDILLRGFENPDGEETTWYDAADIYKAWAKKQFWCKTTFLEKTGFLPEWTRDAPVVMRFNREWFDKPEFMKNWLENYWRKKFPGAPLLAILEGWEHHGDWITTEYFPVYPSEEKFAEMMGWLKAVGGHFWPWPGGHHWNVQVGKKDDGTYRLDFSKDFWKRAAPHAVANPDGTVRFDNPGWLGGGKTATMCPGDPWTVDWWNHEIACELVKRGADLVQADQDVGARVHTCWSRNHGHKPGPGRWLMHAQRRQFETMIEEMRKINPGAMFSFEEMHEYFTDIYAFADYRNCRWSGPEWASVYNYIYHEYTPPFQSGAEQYSRWHWMAFCAADGQMPRLPVTTNFYDERATKDQKEMLAFIESWIRLYRGEGRRWLAHGRQLHPPRIECTFYPYHESFRGKSIDNIKPAVYATAWEAADGSRALMFSNPTPYPQNIAYRWNGKWTRTTINAHELRLTQANK